MSARGRVVRVVIGIAMLAAVAASTGGCRKEQSTGADARADAGASASADAGADARPSASVSAGAEGKALVQGGCLSCHSEHMLAQQRLTQAQWQKTVTKMVAWGANVEPGEVAPLVAYLAENHGPDAGAYVAETIPAAEALAEIAPMPDDPLPPGDPARGKPLYTDKCQGCHGPDARGAIGVNLVDRPFLYRAADVAKTIRKGRGKMLPIALSDAEIADVLAYLRTLKNPPPP